MILGCNNISKAYNDKQILNNVSFHIEKYEKAAIVGINGAGKSTLLKIIMGEETSDLGNVTFAKDTTVGYLAQHQNMNSDNTIFEELMSVKDNLVRLEQRLRQLENQMSTCTDDTMLSELMNSYANVNHQFEAANGYAYKSEVTGVLKGLGFSEDDFNRSISTLSGGQKTRVALSRLLLTKPDIILLDEPTNHLDLTSIQWLETFLLNYSGAVLIVAHDRYFLDKIVGKIIELDNSICTVFTGNYTSYAAKKEQLRQAKINEYLKQQQEIKHQEAVIEKLKQFNREKSIKRAESREKLLDKIQVIDKPIELNASMNLKLEPDIISGNDVLMVSNLTKSFDTTLFEDISFEIKRGEKVALIGSNGTGKTTILKIINNIIAADNGTIRLGSNVNIGYYDQEHNVLNPEKTLFDEISDSYPELNNTKIRNTLAAFLFTGDDVFKKISSLSGGEKGRVSLAKLMLSNANLLLLDEPTNHLDITSKEILENALKNYSGTVLYVSHDRYFINQTATRIIELKGNILTNFNGNYDYYLEKYDILGVKEADNTTIKEESVAKNNWVLNKQEQAALRKAQSDLKKVEAEIEKLETELSQIDKELCNPENGNNSVLLMELTEKRSEIEEKLTILYEKWETLA